MEYRHHVGGGVRERLLMENWFPTFHEVPGERSNGDRGD